MQVSTQPLISCCPAPPSNSFWAGTTFPSGHLSTRGLGQTPVQWHPSHRNPGISLVFLDLQGTVVYMFCPDSLHPEQLAGKREILARENLDPLHYTCSPSLWQSTLTTTEGCTVFPKCPLNNYMLFENLQVCRVLSKGYWWKWGHSPRKTVSLLTRETKRISTKEHRKETNAQETLQLSGMCPKSPEG